MCYPNPILLEIPSRACDLVSSTKWHQKPFLWADVEQSLGVVDWCAGIGGPVEKPVSVVCHPHRIKKGLALGSPVYFLDPFKLRERDPSDCYHFYQPAGIAMESQVIEIGKLCLGEQRERIIVVRPAAYMGPLPME